MHLSDYDLGQLDDAYLAGLSDGQARALLGKALADLKVARERLGQNPTNSSRPPSPRAPWERADTDEGAAATPSAEVGEDGDDEPNPDEAAQPQHQASGGNGEGKRPGRRKGAPRHSRTQQLPVDIEHTHAPECCVGCGGMLSASRPSRAHNARHQIDLVRPGTAGTGLVLQQTKHTYLERQCGCGYWTRAEPGRCGAEADWTVELTDWHLAGPTLVAFIVALTQRVRLSRARVQEFLHDWLGLELSTATINQCIHEAAITVTVY